MLWNGGSLDAAWSDPYGTYHTYSFEFDTGPEPVDE